MVQRNSLHNDQLLALFFLFTRVKMPFFNGFFYSIRDIQWLKSVKEGHRSCSLKSKIILSPSPIELRERMPLFLLLLMLPKYGARHREQRWVKDGKRYMWAWEQECIERHFYFNMEYKATQLNSVKNEPKSHSFSVQTKKGCFFHKPWKHQHRALLKYNSGHQLLHGNQRVCWKNQADNLPPTAVQFTLLQKKRGPQKSGT